MEIAAVCPAQHFKRLPERRHIGLRFRIVLGQRTQHANPSDTSQLLPTSRERPCHCCAAKKRDELAPFHSITSSARASSVCGTLRPSILAVWALMTSSNLVGCTTGKSAGLAPSEDAAGIDADLTPRIRNVGSVAHQPAGFSKFAVRKCRGDLVERRQLNQLDTPAGEESIATDEEGVWPLALKKLQKQHRSRGWCWR